MINVMYNFWAAWSQSPAWDMSAELPVALTVS